MGLQASEVHEGVNAIIHYVSCLATLIDDELGGNPKLKARAYYSGSQLAFAAECETGAQEMLEKMYDEALLTVGDDGDVLSSLGIILEEAQEASPNETCYVDAASDDSQFGHSSLDHKARPKCFASELKKWYRKSPSAENNALDMDELAELLRQGRPDITDSDVSVIFDLIKK